MSDVKKKDISEGKEFLDKEGKAIPSMKMLDFKNKVDKISDLYNSSYEKDESCSIKDGLVMANCQETNQNFIIKYISPVFREKDGFLEFIILGIEEVK